MKSIKNTFIRGLALLLTLILVFNVPVSAFATEITDSVDEVISDVETVSDNDIATYAATNMTKAQMMDTAAFRALKYLGYDREGKLESSKKLFDLTGSNVAEEYRTDIGYDSKGIGHGYETTTTKPTGYAAVNSATSTTGNYPDIATFKKTSLDCVDYATYYLTNYLRNIEGWDLGWLDDIQEASGYEYDDMFFWSEKRTDLIKAGVDVYRVDSFSGTDVKKITSYTVFKDKDTKGYSVDNSKTDIYSLLEPGDLIQMGNGTSSSDNQNIHYAIYAGTYNGKHYMYHCGNDRGPEINIIENMWTYVNTNKKSMPLYFYHFENPEQYGKVSVKKEDPNGKPLAGAKFLLTYEDGRYWELETDATGSASVEDLPLGKYSIKETVSPQGYVLNSTVKTFTLTKDEATYTYSLTNKLAVGNIAVRKYNQEGKKLTGAVFGVLDENGKNVGYDYSAASGEVTFTDPVTKKKVENLQANGKTSGWAEDSVKSGYA